MTSYPTAPVFKFKKPMAFRMEYTNLPQFVELAYASFEIFTPKSSGTEYEISVEFYLNPESSFTNDCLFNGSTLVQPIYKGVVKGGQKYSVYPGSINIWHHLKEIVKLPVWSRTSQIVVVTKPLPPTYNTKFRVMGDVELDVTNLNSKLGTGAGYAPRRKLL